VLVEVGAKASKNLLVDQANGIQQGPRQCGRWKRGASTGEVAGTPHWGWWTRGVAWLCTVRQWHEGQQSHYRMGEHIEDLVQVQEASIGPVLNPGGWGKGRGKGAGG